MYYSRFFLFHLAIALLAIPALAIWVLIWPLTIVVFWGSISAYMASGLGRLIGLFIALILAVILYSGKRKLLGLYGVAEVSIGLSVCWTALGHTDVSSREAALALAAAIYIMVQGIDNMVAGLPVIWRKLHWFFCE